MKNGIATLDEARETYSFTNIVGKMADRASTETKLTRLLIEEKARLLKEKGIPEAEIERRAKVYSFSCSLHKINNTAVAMTQAAEKELTFSKEEISGTRHIYQTDKLICTESNKEYALGSKFRAFCLSSNQLQASGTTLFKPIVGGRYLIYAENAVPTFCGKELIMLFLQDLKETKKLNRLEAGVYDGFLCKKVMTEVRALAIVYHDILRPLYTEALQAATPLAVDYHFAVEKFEMFSVHPHGLLRGNDPDIMRRHSTSCKIDEYMQKVREPSETDDDVLSLLKVMCAAGAAKLKKHAEEHLPGGEYFCNDFNPGLLKAAKIVADSTNNAVESRFASVDNQLSKSRRSNPLSVSGTVAAKHDYIVGFLESQDADVQEELCIRAMQGGRDLLKKQGTKEMQLKRLHEEAEPHRLAKKQKVQERRQKAAQKKAMTDQQLQDGALVRDSSALGKMTVVELKNQCSLWIALGRQTTVSNLDSLKGSSSKKKAQLVECLDGVICNNENMNLNDVFNVQSDPEQDPEEDEDAYSSSSDEEDTQLA